MHQSFHVAWLLVALLLGPPGVQICAAPEPDGQILQDAPHRMLEGKAADHNEHLAPAFNDSDHNEYQAPAFNDSDSDDNSMVKHNHLLLHADQTKNKTKEKGKKSKEQAKEKKVKRQSSNQGQANSQRQQGRDHFYKITILALIGIGFLYFYGISVSRICATNHRSIMGIVFPVFFIHGLAQFLPLGFRGLASCDDGFPWEVHVSYIVILVLTSPGLAYTGFIPEHEAGPVIENGKVPVFGCKGMPFMIFHYGLTLSNALDFYSDIMTTMIAFSCGWRLAWLMAVIAIGSFLAQVAAVFFYSGWEQALLIACGLNSEGLKIHGHGDDVRSHAAIGLTRLITENIGQAVLAIMFAMEVKPSKTVWISAGISIATGLKGFIDALVFFWGPAIRRHSPIE